MAVKIASKGGKIGSNRGCHVILGQKWKSMVLSQNGSAILVKKVLESTIGQDG